MKFSWLLVVVIAVLLVAGFFVYGSMNSTTNSTSGKVIVGSSSGVSTQMDGNTKVITVQASRFQFNPGTITVKKGDHIKIVIQNMDTTHGIAIPDYNVAGVDSVEFTADKAGTFEFHCPTMCGSGHRNMKGTLIVEE